MHIDMLKQPQLALCVPLHSETELRSFSKDVCVGRVMGMWASGGACVYVAGLPCVCSALCVFVLSVSIKEDPNEGVNP